MIDRKQEILNRLDQLLQLVEKEDVHLQGVRQRLFGDIENIDEEWVRNLNVRPEARDFTNQLHDTFLAISTYAKSNLSVSL